jgi:hypothetical protein
LETSNAIEQLIKSVHLKAGWQMAWDSYDDDYHLTWDGWVLGYNRPTDALESWSLAVRQPSGCAPASRFWTQTWVKPGINPDMRAALHRRFPRPGDYIDRASLPLPSLWSSINFGKVYGLGKTLPEIVLSDPDWFFHMHEQSGFLGGLAREADQVAGRARQIRIPGKSPRDFKVQYYMSPDTGKFWYIGIVRTDEPFPIEQPFERCDFLDLSYPRRRWQYDKRGGKRIIRELKILVFGNEHMRLTKAVCERFFNDSKNFGHRRDD